MKSCIIQSCVVDYPKHFFWLFNVILNVTKDKNQFFILQFSKIVKFDLQPTKITSYFQRKYQLKLSYIIKFLTHYIIDMLYI